MVFSDEVKILTKKIASVEGK